MSNPPTAPNRRSACIGAVHPQTVTVRVTLDGPAPISVLLDGIWQTAAYPKRLQITGLASTVESIEVAP